MRLVLHFDGAAFPNAPKVGGDRGIGVILEDEAGRVVKEISERLPGKGSSNSAEYEALIRGLEEAKTLGCDDIHIRGDSQLVIMQLQGKYRVLEPKLRPLYQKVVDLVTDFPNYDIKWVPREQNKKADALSTKPFRSAAPIDVETGQAKHREGLGSSPSKREHSILCPKCNKPCTLTLERASKGEERIRQACAEHGFVCWAPVVEPFVTLARRSR